MLPIKPKIKIKTYQRPNGTNDFKTYLDGLADKPRQKFLTVLKQIEAKGQLVARKNHWLTNVRDTGLIEFRSNVGRNQHRALGYYDHDHNVYVLLTGFTKKDERFNKTTIKTALALHQLALNHPSFVNYQTEPTNVKPHFNFTKHSPRRTTIQLSKTQPVLDKLVTKPVKSKQAPIQSTKQEVKPMPKPNSTTTTDARLTRLFDQIKQLTPNQILILNDLIASWQK